MIKPCVVIQQQMGELFQCTDVGQYIRVRTPFMYPDGDYIDLFVEEFGDDLTISDLGETVRWLKMQSTAVKRSPKQTKLIQDVCLTQNVEFFKGMLQVRCRQGENLASAIVKLSQATIRVSDLWFTFRNLATDLVRS